jgi:putative nucleotidyltransferase with HDIG domain
MKDRQKASDTLFGLPAATTSIVVRLLLTYLPLRVRMGEKKILLADADLRTIREFQLCLGDQWNVVSATSGKAALQAMKQQSFEVLVATLDLPELDGAQLLNQARRKHPNIVRFILAPEADRERVMKKAHGAHQFLAKPLDTGTLRSTLERTLALGAWISNNSMRELVSRVRTFPSIPSIYLEIQAALRSPNATSSEVGAIIAKDMAMMTRLLQVLNSAFYGLTRKITDPAEAVGLLGFDAVKSLVVAIKLLTQYDKVKPVYFSIDKLWRHSTGVAAIAKELALLETGNLATADAAFTGGLIHDIGKVFLASSFDEQYKGVQVLASKQRVPLCEIEKEIFGATHGQIGAYLLGLWGMPLELLEIAAFHHQPARCAHESFNHLTAVHLANALDHELNPKISETVPTTVNEEYIAGLGLLEKLPFWRQLANQGKPPGRPVSMPKKRPPDPLVKPPLTVSAQRSKQQYESPVAPATEPPASSSGSEAAPRRRFALAGAGAGVLSILVLVPASLLISRTDQPVSDTTTTPQEMPQTDIPPAPEVQSASFSQPPTVPSPISTTGLGLSQINTSEAPFTEPKPSFPEVKLQGIFYTSTPAVLINGKIVRVSETVSGVRIIEIKPKSVVLEFNGETKTLLLN